MLIHVHFEKGLGQKFKQAPGTGIDLSLFDEKELLKEHLEENVFPLVVRTETVPRSPPPDVQSIENESLGAPLPKWIHSQTTQAVIEKKDDGDYRVCVVKQIIWINGTRYELQEIYGIEDSDTGKECVICLSEPRDTTVLPCRHMVWPLLVSFLYLWESMSNIRFGIELVTFTVTLYICCLGCRTQSVCFTIWSA